MTLLGISKTPVYGKSCPILISPRFYNHLMEKVWCLYVTLLSQSKDNICVRGKIYTSTWCNIRFSTSFFFINNMNSGQHETKERNKCCWCMRHYASKMSWSNQVVCRDTEMKPWPFSLGPHCWQIQVPTSLYNQVKLDWSII